MMPQETKLHIAAPKSVETVETSAYVDEIISGRPGYFVRHGTAITFLILLLLSAGMWFIRYPDILEGAAFITTDPLPIQLKSESSGRLMQIFVQENEEVDAGQPIVEIENNTGYENVQRLQCLADSVLLFLEQSDVAGLTRMSQTKLGSLGEAQGIYNNLIDAINTYALTARERIYDKRASNLQAQINSYQALSVVSATEKRMIDEQLVQADERFLANEKLYNSKVISRQEYYEEAERLRQKKLALENQRRTTLQNNIAIAGNSKQILDVRYEKEEKESKQYASIREQARNIQNFAQSWRIKYLLCAPFKGKVHYLRPIQLNETLSAGEEICAVVPVKFRYAAYVNLPAQGMGKVKAGQETHLLIDQFPTNEFGYLQGTVNTVSALPQSAKDGLVYRVSIVLPDTLITSFHKAVPFRPQMPAQARIITKDRNLLQRLLNGVVGARQ